MVATQLRNSLKLACLDCKFFVASMIEVACLESQFVETSMISCVVTSVAVYEEMILHTPHACSTWLPCNQGQAGSDDTVIRIID